MRQRDDRTPESVEKTVRDIHRAARRKFSAEERSASCKTFVSEGSVYRLLKAEGQWN